jgi:hypothetical protein
MVKIYLDELWSTWHKTLESQKPADLRLMSERIWENTLRPVSRSLNRHTTPREFCANATGAFLRWEVVGIIVTLVSLVAQSLKGQLVLLKHLRTRHISHVRMCECDNDHHLKHTFSLRQASVPSLHMRDQYVFVMFSFNKNTTDKLTQVSDGDPIFCSHDDAPLDRAALALKMHNASEMCVQFCDDFGVLNDLYLWLLYENTIAYCSMRSKGSKLHTGPWLSARRYASAFCSVHLHYSC